MNSFISFPNFNQLGEEITDTYCPTFAAATMQNRHQSLAKYNFVCNCVCCQDSWPTLNQLEQKFHGLPTEMYHPPFSASNKDKEALKKQIEAYDNLIVKTKADLEESINSTSSLVIVQPQIKTPKVRTLICQLLLI